MVSAQAALQAPPPRPSHPSSPGRHGVRERSGLPTPELGLCPAQAQRPPASRGRGATGGGV